jgi:sulfite reductase (ferredoxin)
MPATPERAAATPRRKAGRHRGEGQWAAGHFTPLNGNEQTKKDDDGLNVRTRIETIYAHRGFDSIDPADLRGRFRWWGLYTQRKPGIDGGKTAILEPEELDDEHFMMRVRIDGGRLTTEQLRVVGEISRSSRGAPPTSPTGRTSSTTGSGSRTCPRSGSGWRPSACPRPRRAATPPA